MTPAPSVTVEVFATAVPPADTHEFEGLTVASGDIPFVIEATTVSAASLLTSLTTTLAPLDAKSWAYLRFDCEPQPT